MKTITRRNSEDKEVILSVDEMLKKLSIEFPQGFSSGKASYFLKREYSLGYFSLNNSGIIKYLIEKGVVTKESQGEHRRSKYYIKPDKISDLDINIEKSNINNIIDSYNNLITPKLGDGSLKRELLDDLKLTLIDYLTKKFLNR